MKKHVRLYFQHFGYHPGDWIACEVPDCGQQAVDIHHIKARGMGGTKEPDRIENLVALCRSHHEKLGDRKQFADYLQEIHNKTLSL